jgi:hypothetical protein
MRGREGSPNGGLIWSTGGRRMLALPDWELVGVESYARKLEGEVN